ncbi:MAG: short-chain dehydrogenase/reductase, partial [Ignavibacteria bacterium]
ESLHYELEQFNIRVKIVEPGIIKTDFAGRSLEFVVSDTVREYDSYVNTFSKAAEGALKDAVDPHVVAQAIFAACTDGKSTLRYPVGKPAPAMIKLRKLVSDSMFFKIVKKAYGI